MMILGTPVLFKKATSSQSKRRIYNLFIRSKMKQKNYFGVLLLGVLLLGCKQTEEKTSVIPVRVETLTIKETVLNGVQGFSGTLEETTGATLSFPTGGTVGNIKVTVGQQISKGALIATVEETALQNTYNATSAMLLQAEDACKRLKQLYDNGSLPEIQWVEAQSKLKQAAAAEQIARKSLDDCRMYAPFSGIISEKNVEMGQNILPGMPVVRLVTINQVKVRVSVPENEIAKITTDQAVRIEVPALGNKVFNGHIVEKGIVANALSRSYEVKALINNPNRELMPGMICQIHIEKPQERKTVIVLPVQVVQLDENNHSFVWVNADGKAQKRTIETGILTHGGVVIEKGLTAGDEVIVEGQQKVSEQTRIVTKK